MDESVGCFSLAAMRRRTGAGSNLLAGVLALLLLAALLGMGFLNPGRAQAGINTWTTNGPAGKSIWAVALSPNYASDKAIFAGSNTGGGGLFKSTNGGVSWSQSDTGTPSGSYFNSLAFSPSFATDHTIFAGTFGGLFKSTNGGASWSQSDSGIPNPSINSLAIPPSFATDHVIFAGVFDPEAGGGDGLFKSTNGGASWSQSDSGILPSGTPILSVAVSPNFATDHTIFAGIFGGLFKSTNGGVSWSQSGSSILGGKAINALAFSPSFATDKTIFAGSANGNDIFKSTNGGASWSRSGSGITNLSICSLAVSPNFAADRIVFAGTDGGGVYLSENGGTSWSAFNRGLANLAVNALAVSPSFATDKAIFAGTDGGVFSNTVTDLPPTASFTDTVSGLRIIVDGSASYDHGDTIASYSWDFGDGSKGSGKTASHTYAKAGTYTVTLTVTDNAGLTGSTVKSVTALGAQLGSNQMLHAGDSLISTNGLFALIYQGDGNLVLYRNRDHKPLWSSNTGGTKPGRTIMQPDGNLVICDASSVARWSSRTQGHPGSRLAVQNDGNVVIYDASSKPLWSTWTQGKF